MSTGQICTLPRQCRLRKADEFRAALRNRVVYESLSLRLYIKPVDLEYARIGLIVAKRIERKAVKRNRIKRLIREAFRRHRQVLRGLDCVVQLRHSVGLLDSPRIYREAVMLFNKAANQL
ncbi:ribonuclease P protein component [uncultured Nitrosomonas sp.]|uniref:ribonuclease P protein component n=1 Tax=uncultured Nitrosomonas sp. TaxID=156424 RepID=UPI002607AD63|nr:ribonuclease P protein component [uncultured Nitrosomonas sp.]